MRFFDRADPCPVVFYPALSAVPRFCGRCGSPLVRQCDPIGFDTMTGEPRYSLWLSCPKWAGGPRKRTWLSGQSPREVKADWSGFRHDYDGPYRVDYLNCEPEPPEPTTSTRVVTTAVGKATRKKPAA